MQTKYSFFLSFVLVVNAYSFDLVNSVTTNLKSKATNMAKSALNTNINNLKKKIDLGDILNVNLKKLVDYNAVNVPGLFGLGFNCDLSKVIEVVDPCKLVSNKSTDTSFNVGSCDLGINLSTKKAYDLVQDVCKSKDKKESNPIVNIRSVESNIASIGDINIKNRSTSNKWYTGEERLKTIKTPDGDSLYDVNKKYFNPAVVYSTAFQDTDAKDLFDSRIYEWKQCIKRHSKHPELCKINQYTLPKTENDVESDIINTT